VTGIGSVELGQALAAMDAALAGQADRDWSVPAGPLTWSCRDTAGHVAHDLVAYAGQLAGRATTGYLPLDLKVRPAATVAEVLAVVRAAGGMLAACLDAADPRQRAWHWGPTDPTGFAALGVNEVLVHTDDIRRGLGLDWEPPRPLCAAVLTRLFPDAPAGDPAQVLLWCTGRVALGDRPRRTSWLPRAAVA
jgi:uncharacterized protein (TIGR03083 family)